MSAVNHVEYKCCKYVTQTCISYLVHLNVCLSVLSAAALNNKEQVFFCFFFCTLNKWQIITHILEKALEEAVPFVQTSKTFCILSRVSLLPCKSPTTLSNNINNIWDVNSIYLLLSWISREQPVSALFLFCVSPQAMVSTLVSVPWDLLAFAYLCVCVCSHAGFIFLFFLIFEHMCEAWVWWVCSMYITYAR